MTYLGQGLVAIGSIGLASGTGAILIYQIVRAGSCVRHWTQPMPRFIRWSRIPAILIASAVQPIMTERHMQRIDRALASVELESALTPASWMGMRIAQSLSAATIAALASFPLQVPAYPLIAGGLIGGYAVGGLWMRKARRSLEGSISRDLPPYLDLLTVCVEAGATLTAGVGHIIEGAPDSPLRRYFEHVLREVRGGQLRAHAFEKVAGLYAVPSLSALAAALGHAESSGMSLGGILRAQGQQRIAERFARAEQLAMQAPVKLLAPLILCIFPCTFVVLAVPIVVRLMEAFGS